MTDDPLAALAHAAMTQTPSLQVRAVALKATLQSCWQLFDGYPLSGLLNVGDDAAAILKALRLGLSDALFQLETIERELQKNG